MKRVDNITSKQKDTLANQKLVETWKLLKNNPVQGGSHIWTDNEVMLQLSNIR